MNTAKLNTERFKWKFKFYLVSVWELDYTDTIIGYFVECLKLATLAVAGNATQPTWRLLFNAFALSSFIENLDSSIPTQFEHHYSNVSLYEIQPHNLFRCRVHSSNRLPRLTPDALHDLVDLPGTECILFSSFRVAPILTVERD